MMEKAELTFTDVKLATAPESAWASLGESVVLWDLDTQDVEIRLRSKPFSHHGGNIEAGELAARELASGEEVDVLFESSLGGRVELCGAILERDSEDSAAARWDDNIGKHYENVIVLRGKAKAFRERT